MPFKTKYVGYNVQHSDGFRIWFGHRSTSF